MTKIHADITHIRAHANLLDDQIDALNQLTRRVQHVDFAVPHKYWGSAPSQQAFTVQMLQEATRYLSHSTKQLRNYATNLQLGEARFGGLFAPGGLLAAMLAGGHLEGDDASVSESIAGSIKATARFAVVQVSADLRAKITKLPNGKYEVEVFEGAGAGVGAALDDPATGDAAEASLEAFVATGRTYEVSAKGIAAVLAEEAARAKFGPAAGMVGPKPIKSTIEVGVRGEAAVDVGLDAASVNSEVKVGRTTDNNGNVTITYEISANGQVTHVMGVASGQDVSLSVTRDHNGKLLSITTVHTATAGAATHLSAAGVVSADSSVQAGQTVTKTLDVSRNPQLAALLNPVAGKIPNVTVLNQQVNALGETQRSTLVESTAGLTVNADLEAADVSVTASGSHTVTVAQPSQLPTGLRVAAPIK